MRVDSKTFDRIIVGDSNAEAYKACLSVADNPNGSFLALCGPSGCGKSHFLSAIQTAYQNRYPNRLTRMISYDGIISEFVAAIRTEKTDDFRKSLCNCDLLLVDNMQFAAGKVTTQEELAYVFFEMLDNEKHVVLALDIPVQGLERLLELMKNRYADRCNIIVIKEHDKTVRSKYLERLESESSVNLSDKVRNKTVNCRRIPLLAFDGMFLKLEMLKEQNKRELTDDEIIGCLKEYSNKKSRKL